MKLSLSDFKQYRQERKQIRDALSLDNRNFW
jgi:hypothetical protein